jgi:hypothetical protein
MEVAHKTDELADCAYMRCTPPATPILPGRRRWRLFNGQVEVVGNIRKSILNIKADEALRDYLSNSRRGTISHLADACFWPPMGRKIDKSLPQRLATSKYLYDWWAVKANQVKKGQAVDEEGADECQCGHIESQAHLLFECTLKEIVDIRSLYSDRRIKLVEKAMWLSDESKATLLVCFTPTRAGTYPDLRAPGFAWPPGDLAKALKLHSDDPLYFFSKGALPVDLLKNDRCEYDYAEAHKFAKLWYQNKLHESKKIWHARNHLVHQDDTLVPWPTLNSQFRDALLSMQALGNKLPHVDKIRKRNRHYMERYIERARVAGDAGSIAAYMEDADGAPLNELEQRELRERTERASLLARRERARARTQARTARIVRRRTQQTIFGGASQSSRSSDRYRRSRPGYLRPRPPLISAPDPGSAPEDSDPSDSDESA